MSLGGNYLMSVIPYYDEFQQTVSYLPDTNLFVLNLQACNTANYALFNTFNDPGNQLSDLQTALEDARTNSETMILVGAGRSPGNIYCNRQWSFRLLALVAEYQDVIRLTMFSDEEDGF